MRPCELDRASRARGMTLAALRASLGEEAWQQSPWRAWAGLARALVLIAAGEALLAALSARPDLALVLRVPVTCALWLVITAGMVGLFVIGHDCGHESFSRYRWVNRMVGHVCMSPILTGFHNWRLSHNHHHARTQMRRDDTDWPEQMLTRSELERAPWHERLRVRLAYGSPVGLLLGFPVGMIRRTFMRALYPQVRLSARHRVELALSNALATGTSGGIAVALALHTGVGGLLVYYLVPLYLGMILGALFTYLHHSGPGALAFERDAWTPLRGQVVSTFDVRFPPWFEALFFHINRHVVHHIAPRVPWYRLPVATEKLVARYPELRQNRRFSLAYLRAAWRAPLLEPVTDGVYEYVSLDG